MRILVTRCSIRYEGRLVTTLETGDRVVLFKDDGSVVVNAVQGAKPINYMPGPTAVSEDGRTITITRTATGEALVIDIEDVHADTRYELEDTAKLVREGREKDIQATIFETPHAIEDGMIGLTRELFTEVGPVDLFCRDADERTCVIEIKRVRATAAAVEQLNRYMDEVQKNPAHAPARGILVAPELAPQARVLLEKWGYDFIALDEVLARCVDGEELMRLF
ncbi:MAG: nucS [Thermoleophilia bacterium]|nr:nucS [Thermoleophilia bacterium]MCZ4496836.1 nucS [Thermoleophilia bacterium]